MEQRRQEFYATVRFVRETLEEIMGSEPYPLHFHILGFDQEFREWPSRSNFACRTYSENISFSVKIRGWYTFEDSQVTLEFQTPWGAEVTEGRHPTISFNGVTWNCEAIFPHLSRINLQTNFQNINGIMDRAVLKEFFSKIRVLYDHQRSVYLNHQADGLYRGNQVRHRLMFLASIPRANNQSLFRGFPEECLRKIAKYMLDLDMRLCGLKP